MQVIHKCKSMHVSNFTCIEVSQVMIYVLQNSEGRYQNIIFEVTYYNLWSHAMRKASNWGQQLIPICTITMQFISQAKCIVG